MAADPRDDFAVFAGSEHMFFQLRDPYAMIRDETLAALRRQVADTELEAIACVGAPKFLTLGRKTDDGRHMTVTHFGFCVRARLTLTCDAGRQREELDTALSFLFGRVDEPGQETSRIHIDVHADAEAAFDDEVFQNRFAAFRQGRDFSSVSS